MGYRAACHSVAALPGLIQLSNCRKNMATDQSFIDYVVEQIALGDRLTYKKMFGEFTLYLDGKIVALACDNSLLVKPSAAAAGVAPGLPERAPYPGAKPCLVADELLDDTELIASLILKTAALMPMPKPKPAKTPSASRKAPN